MSRQQVSAAPPGEVEAFPVWHVLAGTSMFRVTAASSPWWFSSDGSGRFDLPAPRGTCYLADEAAVAMLEALGQAFHAVSTAWLAARQLWTLPMRSQCTAADLTARAARGFGVTGELSTMPAYELPQSWARALAAGGFGGIRYRARHDPAGGRCLALFGRAGARTSWRRGQPASLATVGPPLLAAARIAVADAPASVEVGPVLD